jgi:4'-phosphopantetheinyl transferase
MMCGREVPCATRGWNILPGDVHIWWAELDTLKLRQPEFEKLLSSDESKQARRFRRPQDRWRFVARRAIRKTILGAYLECQADQVRIDHSAFGHPRLMPAEGESRLSFTTSHSHGVAVLALTTHGRIGIDIERLRPIPEASAIVGEHFTPRECDDFERLPNSQRDALFLAIWTAKEALVKALGVGLSFPLDAIHVSMDGDRPIGLVVNHHSRECGVEWVLHAGFPDSRFTGTIVTEHPVGHVQWRRWG